MRIEIFKGNRRQAGKKEKYYFRIRATNGRILATSADYTRKRSAKDTANSLRKNIYSHTPIIEV